MVDATEFIGHVMTSLDKDTLTTLQEEFEARENASLTLTEFVMVLRNCLVHKTLPPRRLAVDCCFLCDSHRRMLRCTAW